MPWQPKIDKLNQDIVDAQAELEYKAAQERERIFNWMPQTEQPAQQVQTAPQPMPQPVDWQPQIAPQTDTYAPQTEQQPIPDLNVPEMGTNEQDLGTTFMPRMPQPVVEPTANAVTTTAPAPQPVADKSWWEQPVEWAKSGEELMGKGLSYIPVLPKVLSAIAPAFEWIHENLEKPFASIITMPFAPDLPWKQGESWLDHTKRNYDEWQAPTYVKGVAEFAMPLWWLPWFGWGAKGARALGIGDKLVQTAVELGTKAETLGKVILPTSEVLDQNLFKPNFFKTVAMWAENKPVLSNIVQAVAGKSALVPAPEVSMDALDIARRALIKRGVIDDMRNGVRGLLMPKLQVLGDPIKLLDIDPKGLVQGVTALDKSSTYLTDMLEGYIRNPANYKFASLEGETFVKQFKSTIDEIYNLAKDEGVKLKPDIVHRIVTGKTVDGEMTVSEYGSRFELQRHYKTMAEGVAKGVEYSNNPLEVMSSTINHYVRAIANKRFDNEIKVLGKTPMEKFAEFYPEEATKITELTSQKVAAQYTTQVVGSILSRKGTSLPGGVMAKIERGMPDVADKLRGLFSIQPGEIDNIVGAMGRDIFKETKLKPATFKTMMAQFIQVPDTTLIMNQIYKGDYQSALSFFTRGGASVEDTTRFMNLVKNGSYDSALAEFNAMAKRIRVSDISDFVHSLNLSNEITDKAIAGAYKAAYQSRKGFITDSLKGLRDEVTSVSKSAIDEVKPYKATRTDFLKHYVGKSTLPNETVPYAEARFTYHPAFGNRFFPKEVVDTVEKTLGDRGSEWLRNVGKLSGFSRMLTASLDFSAGFIQGLVVLGKNPLAWARAELKQFEFAAHPQNMYHYMTRPDVMAIAADRVAHGGSRSTFEFFEAMKPLRELMGKVPGIGGVLKGGVSQTFGRAEAAFTGFGEVARNEMWKALRKPGMSEGELRDLARITDRMTGVMSTEALGISKTQQDFENAFMFFAPRYTRASLAYVADVLKGGMTGNQVRSSLGAMMAGGVSMYIGVSKALGQQPNLNPESSQFMTVKIGDSHVGVGGIMYGLMRLGAGVLATATGDQPLDLVRLSRFDNPFLKFMYQRTSPLTGTLTEIVEQKDYFGQPFEGIGDWAKFMAEKVIPIATQQAFLEKGGANPVVLGVGLLGGRTFPKSAWELRNEARQRMAQDKFGQDYASLPKVTQRQIDETPEIKVLQTEADKRTEQTGKLSANFLQWQRSRDDARFMFIQNLKQAQRAVDVGLLSGVEFKDRLQEARYGLAQTYAYINSRPEYKKVMETLKEPRNVNNQFIGDVAYDELMQATYGGKFENEYGIFDYKGYNQFRETLRQKYGNDVYSEVLKREVDSRKDLPPLAQEYYKARDILKPYWGIADEVSNLFGQTFADSSRGQQLISKQHKMLRLSNPEIDKYIRMFYLQPTAKEKLLASLR